MLAALSAPGALATNADLVKRIQAGETAAFEELIQRYQKPIFNFILRTIGTYHEAEDLTQEVFLRAFQGIKGFQKRADLYTWLYRIAMNICRDYWRRELRGGERIFLEDCGEEADFAQANAGLEAEIEQKELKKALTTAMKFLSPEHRVVLVLHDLQGFTYQEMAEITQAPVGTVKSRLYYARRILRDLLAYQFRKSEGEVSSHAVAKR